MDGFKYLEMRRKLLTGTKGVMPFVLKVLPLPLTAKIKSWLSQDTSDVPSAERNREERRENREQSVLGYENLALLK